MMAVSAPVLPPTYQPDSYPQAHSSVAVNVNVPRSVANNTAGGAQLTPFSPSPTAASAAATFPFPPLAPPYIPVVVPSPPRSSPQKMQTDPAEMVIKSSLPPTPAPSPPTTKVLFPVHMVPLAPEAPESSSSSKSFAEECPSPPSGSDSSHSSSSRTRGAKFGPSHILINTNLPSATHSEVLHTASPRVPIPVQRSETQPNLSRTSTGRGSRGEADREQRDRRGKARRQTMAGPTSVRMVESRSADSRTRLRSTGTKLSRYASIANDFPTTSSSRARRLQAESTPPRIMIPTAADTEDLDFGGPGGLEAKLVLLGSQGVGKTSLILRLTTGAFSVLPAPASLEGSFYKRRLDHNGVPIKLQIWDTAGQERFRSMAPIYYRGAHVCLLVYDTSDAKSFQDVRSWLDELHSKASKDMIIYVVGAKTDLEHQRAVSYEEACRTIRSWLKPPEPETDPSNRAAMDQALAVRGPGNRNLFRSSSGRKELTPTSASPPPGGRARPHSMHGLASLMAAASDWTDLDSPTASSSSAAVPTVICPSPTKSPSPTPNVHFPSSLNALSTGSHSATPSISGSLTKDGSTERVPERPRRAHRVSFHAPAPPAEPTATTTVETATASTTMSNTRHNSRFSISGVLGLTRTTSMSASDALSNLTHLAEAHPVSPRSPPTSLAGFSPTRSRTESSPMLGYDLLPKKRSEEWSSRPWGRGEGPSAADALEEFGASVRHEASRSNSSQQIGRARGGSLGRDHRLYSHGSHDKCAVDDDDEDDDPVNAWGTEIEGVRLGEVSSLTGEGVEAMCRSISACLVERKDKIERERALRHKNSVMLTDPLNDKPSGKTKGRYACCA